jgi:PIN domain nuclease of toxin-antitoxin system
MEAEEEPFLSPASIFEMSLKVRKNKLDIPPKYKERLEDIFSDFDFRPLDIKPAHASLAGRLDGAQADPFDRLLAAQSIIEGMPIMTVDAQIRAFGAQVVW